ncbi:class I SAM-dependent DNA methyltransferase [Candidatus Neptunochlamydia vexilliferae]|nr:class I SAM-dependent methyltransferase [Candidatus Neptunochlamydia vexilliferae]
MSSISNSPFDKFTHVSCNEPVSVKPEGRQSTIRFFNDLSKVESYIKAAEGYDGAELVSILKKNLSPNATILELGIGPGKDMDLLIKEGFSVTGSDVSQPFLDLYRKRNQKADLLLIDAVNINTGRKFDCIYSNKVMIHLSKEELRESLKSQYKNLNSNGVLAHSLWYGDKEEKWDGAQFFYYNEDTLSDLTKGMFEVVHLTRYKEMEKDDSMFAILRKI